MVGWILVSVVLFLLCEAVVIATTYEKHQRAGHRFDIHDWTLNLLTGTFIASILGCLWFVVIPLAVFAGSVYLLWKKYRMNVLSKLKEYGILEN